ncbi:MAG: nucleotidyltransferase domain-containing protein, partial [Methanobacterium sp.]
METEDSIKTRFEDELLLYCIQTDLNNEIRDKIVSLINKDLDWHYLIEMASWHRLRPILYHNLNSICPEKVPEDVLTELKYHYNDNILKNLLLTGELIKILELLNSNGIDVIPYRGPALAILAYGNITLREFNDLDLYINKKDVPKASCILTKNGYINTLKLKGQQEEAYLKFQREYAFKKDIKIEIKWNIMPSHFTTPEEKEAIYYLDSRKNIQILDSNIETLAIEELIILLSVHNVSHYWSDLSMMSDILALIKSNDINWIKMLDIAENMGMKRLLLVNLHIVKDLF